MILRSQDRWRQILSDMFFIGAMMAPGLGPSPTLAQDADTAITEATTLAVFQDPVALAVDPTGVLYVVDAVTSSITRITAAGKVVSTHGGPGRGEYQFDEPSDIDVSAGFVWLVADAGNSRVKRYSSEFLHLASMPVDVSSFAVQQSAGRGGFREEEGAPLQYASGRPISVAATISDETFAVDAENGTVIKWDASRRIERVFGKSEGTVALVDPVSVAENTANHRIGRRVIALNELLKRFLIAL